MAKANEVSVTDNHGKTYPARRSWVLKHALRGHGEWLNTGSFRFYSDAELATKRAEARKSMCQARSNQASLHGRATHPVVLRPNEPEPSTGGAPFLPYPLPRQSSGGQRGLRAQYPTLAKAGAGL